MLNYDRTAHTPLILTPQKAHLPSSRLFSSITNPERFITGF
jgi:hypothetical protein